MKEIPTLPATPRSPAPAASQLARTLRHEVIAPVQQEIRPVEGVR